jgi:serine/threonine-protein kinase RsbW
MGGGERLCKRYPAVAESVPRAREALSTLAESAGATSEQLDAIRLAISEAATNVVVHAYDGHPGDIHVEARLASGELWIRVADDGLGLRPNLDRVRPNIESPGLGVGLAVISQVADAFAISTRSPGGTEVQMRFNLGARRVMHRERGAIAWAAAPA